MELLNKNDDQIFETVADYEQAKANFKALKADLETFEKDLIEQAGDAEKDFIFPDGTLTVPEKKVTGESPKYKNMWETVKTSVNDGTFWHRSKEKARAWISDVYAEFTSDKHASRKPKRKATTSNKKRAKKMVPAK